MRQQTILLHQIQQQVQQVEQETHRETEKHVHEQKVNPKQQKNMERRQRKSLSTTTGTDIGLKIYTTKSRGWAEVPMRKNSLLKGIEDTIINWTYADPNIKGKRDHGTIGIRPD